MDVRFVEDEGGFGKSAGFIERSGGQETRFVRAPEAKIRLLVEEPKIHKEIIYQALRDARRTEETSGFPGRQFSGNLDRSIVTKLSGTASVSGLGALRRTTLSPLGGLQDLNLIDVRLRTARREGSEVLTGFNFDWFSERYIEPIGGFVFAGRLIRQDIDLLVEELRSTSGRIEIILGVGLFPSVLCEWSFEGWDGGKLKFANKEICSQVVSNYEEIPADFFDPIEPFDPIDTAGPHEIVRLQIVHDQEQL